MSINQHSNLSVTVQNTARLHMGFFDLNGEVGRKFGSIGLSLAAPSMTLQMSKSVTFDCSFAQNVSADLKEKVQEIITRLQSAWGISQPVAVSLDQPIVQHAGLGSGTQLALSIGVAMSRLFDLPYTTAQIAVDAQRGARSGIGIAAFDHGGILIDGGQKQKASTAAASLAIPPLLARYDFPAEWAILLITDHSGVGVHGKLEKSAFKTLPAFPKAASAMLCHQVLMKAMPAIVEQDLQAFGESIQVLQATTGDHFAPVQGGRYASPDVSDVLTYLAQSGVACYGQSSWGPTGFAIFANIKEAEKHKQLLKKQFAKQPISYLLTKANNEGAKVLNKTTQDESSN